MIANFFALLFEVLFILILGRVILSWLPLFGVSLNPYNPFVRFLVQSTEPILGTIRRYIPPVGGTIDLSPLIAIVVLQVLRAWASGL